jgi:hypothetical protein
MKVKLEFDDDCSLVVCSTEGDPVDTQTKVETFLCSNKKDTGLAGFIGEHLVFWKHGSLSDTRNEWKILNPSNLYLKVGVFLVNKDDYEVRLGYSRGQLIAMFPTQEAATEYSEIYNQEIDRQATNQQQ